MLSAIVNKGLRTNFGLFAEMGATPLNALRKNYGTHRLHPTNRFIDKSGTYYFIIRTQGLPH